MFLGSFFFYVVSPPLSQNFSSFSLKEKKTGKGQAAVSPALRVFCSGGPSCDNPERAAGCQAVQVNSEQRSGGAAFSDVRRSRRAWKEWEEEVLRSC